jgi:hypothetical protein
VQWGSVPLYAGFIPFKYYLVEPSLSDLLMNSPAFSSVFFNLLLAWVMIMIVMIIIIVLLYSTWHSLQKEHNNIMTQHLNLGYFGLNFDLPFCLRGS